MSSIRLKDPQIADAIENEVRRQRENINLIASENYASRAVLEAQGSVLTNKYAEGYPGRRYYGGCEFIDVAESLAIQRARSLFEAEHANVQPHSGAQANMAAYFASIKPGDTVMGLSLDHGGHLTHGSPVNFSSKLYEFVPYSVDREAELIDYDEAERLAKQHSPKLIVTGATAYTRTIDFPRFREIADQVGATLMVDMAHIAGLIAAGEHPTPVGEAQIITSTTHKTLRGPRGGMVLSSKEMARNVDRAVFPNAQGGPLEHSVAAKAVAFAEAMTSEFVEYQRQIRANAVALGRFAGGRRTPPRRRGHRQPHGACGPATAGRYRTAGGGVPGPRQHSRQPQHHPIRPAASQDRQRRQAGHSCHHQQGFQGSRHPASGRAYPESAERRRERVGRKSGPRRGPAHDAQIPGSGHRLLNRGENCHFVVNTL